MSKKIVKRAVKKAKQITEEVAQSKVFQEKQVHRERRKSGKALTTHLREIFDTHGPFSDQFADQVQGFLIWLMMRYMGQYTDDVYQSCFERVLLSMEYFDRERNLATFIFTVVRNEITRHNYFSQRSMKHEQYVDVASFRHIQNTSAGEFEDRVNFECDMKYYTESVLGGLKRLRIKDDTVLKIKQDFEYGRVSLFSSHILWEATK